MNKTYILNAIRDLCKIYLIIVSCLFLLVTCGDNVNNKNTNSSFDAQDKDISSNKKEDNNDVLINFDKCSEELSKNISDTISNKYDNSITIAVYPFTSNKQVSKLSNFVTEELTSALAVVGSGIFNILTRSKLNELMKEMNLSSSDFFSQEKQISIGKYIGAKLIVTGFVDVFQDYIRINVQLIDVETSSIIWATRAKVNNDDNIKSYVTENDFKTTINNANISDSYNINIKDSHNVTIIQNGKDIPKENDMVLVKGGTFDMGGKNGFHTEPIHSVTINSFYMDITEVTAEKFENYLSKYNPSRKLYLTNADKKDCNIGSGRNSHPVNCIKWEMAVDYCEKMAKRLPSEAEWEYAAGNGEKHTLFSLGNQYDDSLYCGSSKQYTCPVKSYPANDYGLFDMTGNVYEYCLDWFEDNYYSKSSKINPINTNKKWDHSIRGGCFGTNKSFIQVYERARDVFKMDIHVGFRCVMDVE